MDNSESVQEGVDNERDITPAAARPGSAVTMMKIETTPSVV